MTVVFARHSINGCRFCPRRVLKKFTFESTLFHKCVELPGIMAPVQVSFLDSGLHGVDVGRSPNVVLREGDFQRPPRPPPPHTVVARPHPQTRSAQMRLGFLAHSARPHHRESHTAQGCLS